LLGFESVTLNVLLKRFFWLLSLLLHWASPLPWASFLNPYTAEPCLSAGSSMRKLVPFAQGEVPASPSFHVFLPAELMLQVDNFYVQGRQADAAGRQFLCTGFYVQG